MTSYVGSALGRQNVTPKSAVVAHCSCGKAFLASEWEALPLVGIQTAEASGLDEEERLEIKNCDSCGSSCARALTPVKP